MMQTKDREEAGRGGASLTLAHHWKKAIAAMAFTATILGGSFILPVTNHASAEAAMAPSLLQDEKGYISIFEKVRIV